MPNEVINILTVFGEVSEVKEVFKRITTNNDDMFNISFESFIPIPSYLTFQSDIFLLERWTRENWGTKWNVLGTSVCEKHNKVKFWTVDETPYKAMLTVSKLFPNVKLRIEFADEDQGINVGSYTLLNGEMIDSVTPKELSNEAYSMSIDITGDDYYITSFIESLNEDEITEEFPEMCIELAYEKRSITKDFPRFILEKFETLAVRDEDYEFASEVKKLIEIDHEV